MTQQDPLFEKHGNLRTILGHCDKELLENAERVVVSPGVPLENYGLSSLLQSGGQVLSELEFAAEVLPKCIKVLAVTGTNGKSTVTTFAGQMLSHLGFKTFVGGNLGTPLSEASVQCLTSSSVEPKFQASMILVEVSSYQMEIPNKCLCPSVAVVLNLTPDHLERHSTMRDYAMMKCRIFSHMSHSKLAVLPIGNEHLDEAFKDYVHNCNVAWLGAFPGVKVDMEAKVADLRIPYMGVASRAQLGSIKAMGTHNYHNAAVAALSVLGLNVGIDTDSISETIATLRTLPHRMQIVRRDNQGVTWVDDSKATNVESTYTGLMGLKEQKSVVLLGGVAKVLKDRKSNGFEQLVEPLMHHRCVITFGSSGKMIQETLQAGGLRTTCIRATNLEDAVNCARSMARYGDAIVLSPGCASFDEFKNFEHRGKVFQELAFAFQ
ncbi:Mur ligase [Macleaya cordata]|uniref:Mur ligase n=1 Tax=Macleaya cordata TaxID=56857 RepID=A0A200QBQ8_MACCD|nr:Mur ligase [Macleaya cordata]